MNALPNIYIYINNIFFFITLTLTLIAFHNIPRSLWAHNLLLKGTQTEMGNTSDGDSLCNQYLVRLLYQCYT